MVLNQARSDLICFEELFDAKYYGERVHRGIAQLLESVWAGRIKRLTLSVPSQHGKSTLVSSSFVSWLLGKDPSKRIGLASYSADLSKRFSMLARWRVASPLYQKLFPETRLQVGNQRSDNWGTTARGFVKAAGIGGGFLGFPLDCVLEGTKILTEAGEIAIEHIEIGGKSGRVLSYHAPSKQFVFRHVQAVSHRQTDGFYRITTSSGRVVEASGGHPFFTGSRYVKASSLAPGDLLLRAVPIAGLQTGLPDGEGNEKWDKAALLLEVVRRQARPDSTRQGWNLVSDLRGLYASREVSLLEGVQQGVLPKGESEAYGGQENPDVPPMFTEIRQTVSPPHSLLKDVCEPDPRLAYEGGRQSRLAARYDGEPKATRIDPALQHSKAGNSEAGQQRMRGLRREPFSGSPSHQHETVRQSLAESRDDVQEVPSDTARCGSFQAEADAVALVELIRQPSVVWNLQVQGTENFFANGILTHNCLIIDDPFASFKEAHSASQREAVWEWYAGVGMQRMAKNGSIICIQTRWHPDDLIGRLQQPERQKALKEDRQWVHVNLEALAPADDPLGRPLGEPLAPRLHSLEDLEELRSTLGTYLWDAMYCGRPRPRGGNYMDSKNLILVDSAPEGLMWVRFWDLAASEKERSDFTAGACAAEDKQGNLWIRDIENVQLEWPKARALIVGISKVEAGYCGTVGVEAVGGFKTSVQNLREVWPPTVRLIEVGVDEDKICRAIPWMTMAENKKVMLVRGKNTEAFLSQVSEFPKGEHDDMIDGVSGAVALLRTLPQVPTHAPGATGARDYKATVRERRVRTLLG